MSRIGKKPVTIPEGVKVEVSPRRLTVKSGQIELSQSLPAGIEVKLEGNQALVKPRKSVSTPQTKALHGLVRSLLANMIIGVTQGFEKTIELQGTGYRINPKGSTLELSLGFSHPVIFEAPPGISFSVEENKIIKIKGADKQLVGQVAAEIRHLRPPDAYKGKGFRYLGETVKLKPGKSAKTIEGAV
jgi:large subunit ribosomal protein L6